MYNPERINNNDEGGDGRLASANDALKQNKELLTAGETEHRRYLRAEQRLFGEYLNEFAGEDRRLVEKYIVGEKMNRSEALAFNGIKNDWWAKQTTNDGVPCKDELYRKDFLRDHYRFERESFDISKETVSGGVPEQKTSIEDGLKNTAEWLRQIGLPVDDECRLDMDEYAGAVFDKADVEKNKKFVNEAEERFAQEKLRQGGLEKIYTLGEQMERFATVLMARFFKQRAEDEANRRPIAVVRTARFDDIENHIDYVLFDTATGEIMGAIDVTIADENKAVYNKKEERITGLNIGGRGELKYGLDVDKIDPDKKIVLKPRKSVPVFLLNLPKNDLRDYLQKIDYDGQEVSELETKVIKIFLDSIVDQIRTYEVAGWDEDNKESFARIKEIYKQINPEKL